MKHDTYSPPTRHGPRPAPPLGQLLRVLVGTVAAVAVLATPPATSALAVGVLTGWLLRPAVRRSTTRLRDRMHRVANRDSWARRLRVATRVE